MKRNRTGYRIIFEPPTSYRDVPLRMILIGGVGEGGEMRGTKVGETVLWMLLYKRCVYTQIRALVTFIVWSNVLLCVCVGVCVCVSSVRAYLRFDD